MPFDVLTAHGEDAGRWHEAIAQVDPGKIDFHWSPEYAAVQEKRDGEARLLVYRAGDRAVVQPVMIRRAEVSGEAVVDIENPYGYGGPIASAPVAYSAFAGPMIEWAKSIGAVAERCVLHPFFHESQRWLLRGHIEPALSKNIVYLYLGMDFADNYHRNRKQGIAQARKTGVQVRNVDATAKDVATFCVLYNEMMNRKDANARWRLAPEYFAEHFKRCPEAWLFLAEIDGDVEVATIVMSSPSAVYYHFSASAMRHPHSGASDLMVDTIARWALDRGMPRVHLGGGVTSATDDTLLAYKASFSDFRAPVLVYNRVFDQARYDALSAPVLAKWGCAPGTEPFFPAYRWQPN